MSKISFCSHAAEAILFVDLKKTTKHDVIIPDYSKYSALWSRMFGIHSMYSGIRIASQSNGCSGLFLLFLFRNSVNRTHPELARGGLGTNAMVRSTFSRLDERVTLHSTTRQDEQLTILINTFLCQRCKLKVKRF